MMEPLVQDDSMDEVLRSLVGGFRDEARELLCDMESALMELEGRPEDGELVARAFRALHTIKGNGAMFGLTELERFAHDLEHIFDLLRKGEMPVTSEIIDLTLGAKDRLLALLGAGADTAEECRLREADRGRIARLLADAGAPDPTPPPQVSQEPERFSASLVEAFKEEARAWRIIFQPERRLFADGTDPLPVFEELRAMGECSVTALLGAVPSLEEIDPGACYLSWELLLTTSRTLQEIRDTFIFVGGDAVVKITLVEHPAALPAERAVGDGSAARPLLAAAAECGPVSAAGAAPTVAHGSVAAAALQKTGETATTLRVGAAKLDKLVDLVGELVTVQARLSLMASLRTDPELLGVAEDVERLTAELRDHSLNVRMVPIGPAFGKFRRLVRDLSHEIGRQVEMTTAGEDTELDKNVIDRLNNPIVHLLRNSIDHGIETQEQRRRAGKPARGRLRLSAAYAGANVVIRVEDDGAGIDAAAVRQRAVQRGLIGESDQRTERELHALMFLPGFSTSEKVTNISGRGVGLDVVKRAVEALRGRVHVQSRSGEGTVFEIRIPLTLAIIEGLEVVLGGDHLILPLSVVKECVELVRRPGDHGRERSLVEIRGELVPYVRLRDWFKVPGEAPAREQIVVTETDDQLVGLVVDHVVGGQQTVIKPLGRLFRDVRGLSGATILGDGTVALILDVVQLVQHVERADLERSASA